MLRQTCYVSGMPQVSDSITRKLCQVIDSLLAEGPIQERLADATRCLDLLEFYKSEFPTAIFNEFTDIIRDLTEMLSNNQGNMPLAPEQEIDLTNKMLSLYIEISGGVLIF
jgi:hypothetical protein